MSGPHEQGSTVLITPDSVVARSPPPDWLRLNPGLQTLPTCWDIPAKWEANVDLHIVICREFFGQGWMKLEKNERTPYIMKNTKHFNDVSAATGGWAEAPQPPATWRDEHCLPPPMLRGCALVNWCRWSIWCSYRITESQLGWVEGPSVDHPAPALLTQGHRTRLHRITSR